MNNLFIYLLKVSLISGALYFLFFIFFRNTSFHKLNRIYLLFIIIFSLIGPSLKINLSANYVFREIAPVIPHYSELIQSEAAIVEDIHENPIFSAGQILSGIYLAGCLLFLIFLSLQLTRIFRIRYHSVNKPSGNQGILLSDRVKAPFSFFNWIFIPLNYTPPDKHKTIIYHEKVHARNLHTADLILCEIFRILLWFNPVSHFLKRSVKSNHEFLVDADVLGSDYSLSDYIKLLIHEKQKLILSGVYNQFSNNTLKKRVNMMLKPQTPANKKLLYFIALPVIFLILASFSGKKDQSENIPNTKPLKEENIEKISSAYGMRIHPVTKIEKMHYGIDLVAKQGTAVLVTADGTIMKTDSGEKGKGYGRHILIKHNEIYSTLYTQLSAFNVKAGDEVKQGEIIGYVGSSGLSTGPHLHYEVHKNGERVNPEDYFGE